MATQAYRLTFVVRVAGSDAGTTQQTVTIATETTSEAVELAQLYRAGLSSEALVSATLADVAGHVLWSEQADGAPRMTLPQGDQP